MSPPSPPQALRDLQPPARQLLEHGATAAALCALDGTLLYANPAFVRLWACADTQAVVGRSAADVVWMHADEAAIALSVVRAQGSWQGEVPSRRADGRAMLVHACAHLVQDAAGGAIGVMLSFLERRAEPAAREDLQAQVGFVEAVIGAAGVLVLVLDEAGRFVRFNRECERLSGWRADEVLGRTPWETVLPDDAAEHVRRQAFDAPMSAGAGSGPFAYTNDWVARDGRRLTLEWSNTLLRDAGGVVRHMVSVGIDVTERERARREALASQQRLQRAQQVTQTGVWELDHRSGRLDWSDEVYRLFELDREREVGSYEHFLAAVLPEDRAFVEETYSRSLLDRQPYRIEHRLRMADGRIKWVEERCETSFDTEGRPLRSLGTVQDVTERHRLKAALLASEATLRATLDIFPGWVACADDDLRYVFVNEHLARSLDRPQSEIVGRLVGDLRGEHVAAELREVNRRLLAGERIEMERRYLAPDGGERRYWVQYRVADDPARPGRHIFYAFGTELDELQRTQLRLKTLVESTRIGTWEWDLASARLEVNKVLADMIDHTPEQMARMAREPPAALFDLVHPEDRARRQSGMRSLLDRSTTWYEGECRVRDRDGRWLWVLERATAISFADNGAPLVLTGTIQDISSLKRTEQQLRQLNDELEARVAARTRELEAAKAQAERASVAKSEFLSRMSHELRTPLNAIIGFGQLLELSPLAPDDARHAQEIMRAGRHLLELINEVLDLATVEAGRMELRLRPVPLAALIDESLALVGPAARQAGLAVENLVAHDCQPVLADRGRLKQVLLNLLSNAVKYNRAGGRVTVSCTCDDEGDCMLRIVDTGPGLAPEQVARLFQPFERLHAGDRGIEGTGIGLSVSKRLVELMHGQIGVDSTPGRGSTFWLRLPTTAPPSSDADMAAAPAAPGAVPAAPPAESHTLLYVEDNEANLLLMRRIVARRPRLRLLTCQDPLAAVDQVREARPDLVLLDIQMSPLDGFEVLARLRADGATMPVIAVSANAMAADIERAQRAGFAAYLTKPLDLQRLWDTVDAHLPQRPAAAGRPG